MKAQLPDTPDLDLLHSEFAQCRRQLEDLNAMVNSLLVASPADNSALEQAARRMRDIAKRLADTTQAIAKASKAFPRKAN